MEHVCTIYVNDLENIYTVYNQNDKYIITNINIQFENECIVNTLLRFLHIDFEIENDNINYYYDTWDCIKDNNINEIYIKSKPLIQCGVIENIETIIKLDIENRLCNYETIAQRHIVNVDFKDNNSRIIINNTVFPCNVSINEIIINLYGYKYFNITNHDNNLYRVTQLQEGQIDSLCVKRRKILFN